MRDFPSRCQRCDHVEWFYTKEGRDRYEALRESSLPRLPFMKHRHPVRDFFDDIVAARNAADELRKAVEKMKALQR